MKIGREREVCGFAKVNRKKSKEDKDEVIDGGVVWGKSTTLVYGNERKRTKGYTEFISWKHEKADINWHEEGVSKRISSN